MEAEVAVTSSVRREPIRIWPRRAGIGLTANRISLTVVAGALVVLYLPAFVHAVEVWRTDPDMSFGFFGLPGATVVLLMRRRELAAARGAGTRLGLALLVVGLATMVVGRATGVHAVTGLSLLPTCIGAAAYVAGTRFARLLILPLGLLTATISLYYGLLNSLGFWLQQATAVGATAAADLAGASVVRSGVDLFVGNSHFVVAEACSGMSSLLALLFLGLLVTSVITQSWPAQLLLLGSAVPIVLITNITRVTVVLVTSGATGSNLETGLPHALLSGAMFLCAGSLFVVFAFALRRLPWLSA